jgi:primosomal protein N' (replication factor Y)
VTGAGDPSPLVVARVVPDVTGLDKQFDYLVPEALLDSVSVGSMVRVPLHGRRIGGWVVALSSMPRSLASGQGAPVSEQSGWGAAVRVERLLPIAKWSSVGPAPELIELAEWAACRWGASRVRPFLVAADPPRMVARLPAVNRTVNVAPSAGAHHADELHWLAPLTDPLPLVIDIVRAAGPTIVVHPSPAAAAAVARRLRKTGLTVALMPDDWAAAAGGVDVVVGSRVAVWAPCPGLRTVVVLDEHDEALQEERAPTWHARDVAIERARRSGTRCVLVSPCPTATAVRWAGAAVRYASASERVHGWPFVDVVDRSDEEPWRRSLVSSALIAALRDHDRRVVCVLNTPGRARLLACRSCKALQRCTACDAAVTQGDDGQFVCRRCGLIRPPVCQACGSTAMANVKPGVSRLREELAAAANREVFAVTGESAGKLPTADVYVGTEAVLHRVRNIDTVAFLDFDAELLAPRYRAAEQVMALLVRAGRLVGPRGGGGRVLVQTHVPHHELLQAVVLADPLRLVDGELARRRRFGLPPFGALAAVEGSAASDFAAVTGLEAAPTAKGVLLRATSWDELASALESAPRPKGSRLRVEVDPPRA